MNTFMIITIQLLMLLLSVIAILHYLSPVMKRKNIRLHLKTKWMEIDLET